MVDRLSDFKYGLKCDHTLIGIDQSSLFSSAPSTGSNQTSHHPLCLWCTTDYCKISVLLRLYRKRERSEGFDARILCPDRNYQREYFMYSSFNNSHRRNEREGLCNLHSSEMKSYLQIHSMCKVGVFHSKLWILMTRLSSQRPAKNHEVRAKNSRILSTILIKRRL